MNNQKTTVKSKGLLATAQTDLEQARTAFRAAWKEFSQTHSIEAQRKVERTRAKVFKLEDEYRKARKLILAHIAAKQEGTQP